MTGRQLRAARQALGLSQAELASALDVHERTVRRWENEERAIPPLLERALKTLRGVSRER